MRDTTNVIDPSNALRVMENIFERGFVAHEHAAITTRGPLVRCCKIFLWFMFEHLALLEWVGGVLMVATDRPRRSPRRKTLLVQRLARAGAAGRPAVKRHRAPDE